MPEGHTVHRVARHFRDEFVGHAVFVSSPQGRFAEGARSLDEHTIVDATAVGKQLFVTFDNGLVMRVHLGIYGAWTFISRARHHSIGAPRAHREEGLSESEADVFPPEPVGQVRVRIATDEVVADLRGPTACEVIDRDEAKAIRASLGPDPLVDGPVTGLKRFRERMMATRTPVALALMNQNVVAGIGNVYRAEILFRHRLDPYAPANSLPSEVLDALWKDWGVLLKDGVKTGVMRTRSDLTAAQRTRSLRDSRLRYYVYKRQGKPCRVCHNPVALAEMASRKLYYCPHCQVGPHHE
ncbi:MAG: Fpg/Nei family DNA glycosylase [Pontimonas sp.]